jgi:hypothetical protein
MTINNNTTLREFIFHAALFNLETSQVETLFKKLEQKGRPLQIAGKQVPENLNDLTFGQLAQIQSITTTKEMLLAPLQILINIPEKDALNLKAFHAIQFMLFIQKEITRIAKLFTTIQYKPSPEEIQAGINQINNGLFGTIDWYARRMKITNHAEVETIPWLRIYKCMEMDNKSAIYEKKLREIYSKKKQ